MDYSSTCPLGSQSAELSEEDTVKIARGNATRMLELEPELPVGLATKG